MGSILLASSQTKALFGVSVGGDYYQGEINWDKPFYHTHFSYGAHLRYVLNKRYSLKGGLSFGWLSASDKDSKNSFQQVRRRSFQTPIAEIIGQIEFNFKTYKLGDKKYYYTPYMYLGSGLLIASWSHPPYNLIIPFGLGYKLSLSKKIEMGFEFGYRKVFSDGLDNITGVKDVPEKPNSFYLYRQYGFYNNKDWYSLFGIHLLMRIYAKGIPCYIYEQ
jgi:hypothetical protein